MRRSILVTFSGLDGCGKSTQLLHLKEELEARGERPVLLWSRGGYTGLMEAAKAMARLVLGQRLPPSGPSKERTAQMNKKWVAWLWLNSAILDLARLYSLRIRRWQLSGRPVLCDRYFWDSLVDFRMLFPQLAVEEAWSWKLARRLAPRPDAAFLLDLTPEMAQERSLAKGDPFPESLGKRKKRAAIYRELAARGLFVVLDAVADPQVLFGQVRDLALRSGEE